MPSQQEVAARANVSYMTVSRVVNNHPSVKKETRALVLKAIEELGYHPNASARALNALKTGNIGLIFPPKENVFSRPFYMELSLELEDQLNRRGYHLFVGMTRTGDQYRDPSLLIKEHKVDGLILVAPRAGDPEVERLISEGLPLVILHGRGDQAPAPCVDTDNVLGTGMILRYLLQQGHRRIGFVSGNMDETNARDRYNAYCSEIQSAGLVLDSTLVYRGDWSMESGYEAFSALRERVPDATALCFSNDQMALGAFRAAYDRGLSVPDDISITGYDDTKYASFAVPALTTVRQPLSEVASAGVELVLERIRGDVPVRSVVLRPELKIRSSCRPIAPPTGS